MIPPSTCSSSYAWVPSCTGISTGGKKPGTLYRFKGKELEQELKDQKLSLHQFSLLEALLIHKKVGDLPEEIVFIGIEPQDIEWGLEVTEGIKEKIPQIIRLITEELPN